MKEQIRGALDTLPDNVIKDSLAILMSGESVSAQSPVERDMSLEEIKDFLSLMTYIKRNYDFTELNSFIIEGGNVYFKDGNKSTLISRSVAPQSDEPKKTIKPKNNSNNKLDRFGRLELD